MPDMPRYVAHMTPELITALATFAFVTSITPGPNNLMLMASGANFGFQRSLAHMFGIGIGFLVMVVLVGFGLAQIFQTWPTSYEILRGLSVAYLLYLAWKTATAAGLGRNASQGKPMSFLQAAAFQWVNPKAWAMALGAISAFAPDHSPASILTVALIFAAINLPCVSSWTILGQQMARFLTNQHRRRVFNLIMASLLVLTLIPVIQPWFN